MKLGFRDILAARSISVALKLCRLDFLLLYTAMPETTNIIATECLR